MLKILAVIIEFAVFAVALWLLSFLSTFLHEAGHAVGYLLATGDTHWHIRVGWGKRLLNTKRLSVNLLPFDGFFTPVKKEKIHSKAQLIMILSGGPIVSLILVAGLLLLKFGGISFHSEVLASGAVESFIHIALFSNLLILLMAVIPIHYFHGKIKGLESDGLQIIRILKSHGKDKPQDK